VLPSFLAFDSGSKEFEVPVPAVHARAAARRRGVLPFRTLLVRRSTGRVDEVAQPRFRTRRVPSSGCKPPPRALSTPRRAGDSPLIRVSTRRTCGAQRRFHLARVLPRGALRARLVAGSAGEPADGAVRAPSRRNCCPLICVRARRTGRARSGLQRARVLASRAI